MSVPTLWYRTFSRQDEPGDIDTVASAEYLEQNFADPFGRVLYTPNSQGQVLGNRLTQDDVMKYFAGASSDGKNPDYTIEPFAVADGMYVPYSDAISSWFNPHLRFLYVVTAAKDKDVYGKFTAFVVGSPVLDDPNKFLQVASWDPKISEFRFYEKTNISTNGYPTDHDPLGWVYNGKSSDAFGVNSYLGPFNGHVNGAVIMKEILKPWIHWKSADSNVIDCLAPSALQGYMKYPYLSRASPLDLLKLANDLEPVIESGVMNWFSQRMYNDFVDSNSQLRPQPCNVKRWAAHLVLTTTINIAAGQPDPQVEDAYLPPIDFVIDQLTLKNCNLWPVTTPAKISFVQDNYDAAVKAINLVMMQEIIRDNPNDPLPPDTKKFDYPGTLGGGRQTNSYDQLDFKIAQTGEGPVFTCLQSSIEDANGALRLYKQSVSNTKASLLWSVTVQALVSFDFCNPIYSWRRGVLLQYFPEEANLLEGGRSYDYDTNFFAAIKASPHMSDPQSPEAQFVAFAEAFAEAKVKASITAYFKVLQAKFKQAAYVEKYMRLAESRRRIYRPLPLDEFGYTLPYAWGIPQNAPWLEMTVQGEVVEIPPRGVEFLSTWRGTLHGFNPVLVPNIPSHPFAKIGKDIETLVSDVTIGIKKATGFKTRRSVGCPYTQRNLQ